MKQNSKKFFSIALLLSTTALAVDTTVLPFLQWRSQGRNTARKVIGMTNLVDQNYEDSKCNWAFDLTLEYDRSFHPQYISDALFGESLINFPVTPVTTPTTATNSCKKKCDNNSRTLLIQGFNTGEGADTDKPTKNAKSWMAENFFLPNDYQSAITFKPLVQNILVNFDFYFGFDRWCNGLYMRLYGPVVNNRTNLEATENTIAKGADAPDAYSAGFIRPTAVPRSDLFDNALEFFAGNPLTITDVKYDPLLFAKMNGCGNKSKTGFAELRGELGWNWLKDNYRLGFNIQAAAPTGTRPNAEFLLEPQVGNGHHWELGGGLKGAWTMWRSEDEEKHFDFIVEADITHLFNAKQRRTFDLKTKPNSRYMLAEKLSANTAATVNPLTGVSASGFQATGEYSPVANFSTRDVKVSIGVQGDLVAMFTYTVRGFTWDLGYNFWGMSHEKISLSCDTDSDCPVVLPFAPNTWALKGDASTYGTATIGTTPTATNIALSPSESAATIYAGSTMQNTANSTIIAQNLAIVRNTNVDNAQLATVANGTGTANVTSLALAFAGQQMFSSNPVKFISADDLDLNGAELRGYSNKIFTHFSYAWTNHDRWVPFFGAGASAEFGSHSSSDDDCPTKTTTTTTNNCDSGHHNSFALSQWAVYLKGGVSFH